MIEFIEKITGIKCINHIVIGPEEPNTLLLTLILLLVQPLPYVPTITNYTNLWWLPNAVVAHEKEGIEVFHLPTGRTLCKVYTIAFTIINSYQIIYYHQYKFIIKTGISKKKIPNFFSCFSFVSLNFKIIWHVKLS